MIEKDAINILKGIQRENLEENDFLGKCAIDMAIEALKEEKVHLICPHCLKDMYYTKVTHTIELGGDEERR